jgi:hypothetical protein
VSPKNVELVLEIRNEALRRIDKWANGKRELHAAARREPAPGEPRVEGKVAVGRAMLEISRKHAEHLKPLWGEFRTEEDQMHEQREQIAFDVAHLQNSRNPQPYNIDKNRGDYNDGWLLAYCSAGYHFVTSDGRLRAAIRNGGCTDPRVVDVPGALDLAEAWLNAEGRSAAE